ncbi:hypothetical protein CEE37_08195 [candidate division LCP-89 bacterium B3_LCP]|uniref:FAD/NAD(P)-binding domain-containing protein n=1 Tax=candidate division LCP-89 bacterium B3_LCP TaxID=2012998 RepID=A0A532UZZ4_UNCL8|nr:MAG: hypothetical protein CEE37_08195 [candidate division LCP-89 bacterium B3_LCP]
MQSQEVEVLIIGAGPAGIAAALQLKRAGFDPFIVEKDRIGGALLNAGWVENYPGFARGISGLDLAKLFQEHLEELDIQVQHAHADDLHRMDDHFIASINNKEVIARTVIVAAGTTPNQLDIHGVEDLSGKKVFTELRNLPESLAGTACIIGGGDAAFDYALSLAWRKMDVIIAMRSASPCCLRILDERVLSMSDIKRIYNAEPVAITREKSQVVVNFRGGTPSPICADLVLCAVGRHPELAFLSPELKNKPEIPQFHFIGDVVNGSCRQVGIAVGDGLRCAMEITQFLQENNQ